MANRITESAIEEFAIELLEKQGFQYAYGPDLAPDSDAPERKSFENVLLLERLRRAVERINPSIPPDAREDAIKQLLRLNSPELVANNEAFHRMLTEGIKVNYRKDGNNRGDLVWLVDFSEAQNNDFVVLNQFTVIENNVNKRPDDAVIWERGDEMGTLTLEGPTNPYALPNLFIAIEHSLTRR